MPDVPPWARVAGDVNVGVRRGAWYQVMRLTTVVACPYDAVDLPFKWGSHYGVCPRCSRRAALPEQAVEMQCPACQRVFPLRVSQRFSDRGPFGDTLR